MMKKNILFILGLITLGVLTRTVAHLGENIEFVTALGLSATLIIKDKKLAFLVPLFIMFFSDLIIGSTLIFLFTWTGFLFVPVFGNIIQNLKLSKNTFINLIFNSEIGGIFSTVTFFLWTNFGVVLTTTMYTKNFAGLLDSYINGLPFLYNQLVGNLIIVPIVVLSAKFIYNFSWRSLGKYVELIKFMS